MLEKELAVVATNRPSFVYLNPADLRFDIDNPRFGGQLANKSQPGIQQYLMGKPHYASELVDSLLVNGFIDYEPLVAKKDDGHFVVLEGNRRLAAVKHILEHKDQYTSNKIESLNRIPVLVFPSSTGKGHDNAETIYLGVRHLFGFREWPPLSKAKFLHKEISSADDLDRAVRELGITKQEVRRYLIPYRVLLKGNMSIPEGQDFWILGEALSRSGISKYIELELDRKTLRVESVNTRKLNNLMDFLYGKLDKSKKTRNPETAYIKDTRQLRELSKVLQSERATQSLESVGDLQLSLVFVETREENVKRLGKLLNELARLLKDGLNLRSSKPDEGDLLRAFRDFQKAASTYLKNVDSNL